MLDYRLIDDTDANAPIALASAGGAGRRPPVLFSAGPFAAPSTAR